MIKRTVSFLILLPLAVLGARKPDFISGVVSPEAPAVRVEADITGAATLALVVDDAGDSYGCDWADWVDPVLVGPQGEVKLTTLKWSSATTGHGEVNIDRNAGGSPMIAAGQPAQGIGTHANSAIQFDIAGNGFTRFRAKGALDKAGTDQGCGSTVRFAVYALKAGEELPKAAVTRNTSGGGLSPADTLAGLETAEGLEVTLFASEPLLQNPTDIDVDARGRVWVCEGVNYRKWKDNRPEGDRIVIIEDTDRDGTADKSTVFHQGPEINAALGICVLGNHAIVSCSPDVFMFYDDDGDGKADRKEVLFTGISGVQHDHGMHAFVFGPDGRFYFNFGNSGNALKFPGGSPVVDRAGNEINAGGNPYRQGIVFRCDQGFKLVDTVGWNFRNNYEVTVDSFGTLWQSDNDDDGNKGVRINYVMEYGNYGYSDEMTGAGWQQHRANMETNIPHRHWHQNDPGTVPNLLFTGAGSPCGITVYEGDLLPDIFRNQMIHCDAGPRATRAYPLEKDGAGFKAEIADLLTAKDNWHRPCDVSVMPDGSLIVADWYDPGVGGHNMGDNAPGQMKGRLYRVAPKGHKPQVPLLDFMEAENAAAALKSPNYATRYLAWQTLHQMGASAVPALTKLWNDRNPRIRARALWLLAFSGLTDPVATPRPNSNPNYEPADQWIQTAIADGNEDLRIAGLRIARQIDRHVEQAVKALVHDTSPQVRRECAIALRHSKDADAPALWAELAAQHDGRDRWYLEALGIGADRNETAFLDAYLKKAGGSLKSAAARDIVWRSRGEQTPGLLADILLDPATTTAERPRYIRALDFQKAGTAKDAALVRLLANPELAMEAATRMSAAAVKGREDVLEATLAKLKGRPDFVELIQRFGVTNRIGDLLAMALGEAPATTDGTIAAARQLIAGGNLALLTAELKGKSAAAAANALGLANDIRALPALEPLVTGADTKPALHLAAVDAMAKIERGANRLLQLAGENKLPADAKETALRTLAGAPWEDVQKAALQLAPANAPVVQKLPASRELAKNTGDAVKGQILFQAICTSCHQVNGLGVDYGPALSEIGTKLGKEALYDALLNPSAGISFGFETHHVKFKSGDTAIGLLVSETGDEIALKSVGGAITRYAKRDIAGRPEKLKVSSMPAIAAGLPAEQLADLVEYLASLKKK